MAQLRIQVTAQDGGRVLGDTTITADDHLILYSVGYDADGNYLGRVSADWDSSGQVDRITPANPTDSIFFEAVKSGSGTLSASADTDPNISDKSGLITINSGATAYIKIRTEPGNKGIELGDSTITAGSNIDLFAAGYDSDNNYTSEVAVNWHVNNTLSGLGDSLNISNTTLTPLEPGSGQVYTSNSQGWTDDQTGTITVRSGSLASLKIQTQSGEGGAELGVYTGTAGDSLLLYAAGYDDNGNYLGLQNVVWSQVGDSIGFYKTAPDSAQQNTFYFRLVNSAQFKIQKSSISDYSEIIDVDPGAAAIVYSNPSDTVTARVNDYVTDSLRVKITDAYGNVVPDVTVNWSTGNGGSVSPQNDVTDRYGISRSRWRVKNTTGADSARAIIPAIPDTADFFANVLNSNADSLAYSSGNNQQGTVTAQLTDPFVVQVLDSLSNPVEGTSVTFSVDSVGAYPEGGNDYVIHTVSALTDANGYASTKFTLGSKAGFYLVSAHNSQLRNSPVVFSAVAAAASADTIRLISGNDQSGTAGSALTEIIRVRITDAYNNPIENVGLKWLPTSNGSVSATNDSSYTDAEGYASTTWTLRTTAGADTLNVTSGSLPAAMFTATVNAAGAARVLAYSGNGKTTIAGGNQSVTAQVQDQYGNAVQGATVTFEPATRFSNHNVQSDMQGLANSIYITPSATNFSTAKAYVSGLADTAQFKIYGITYVGSSLSPQTANPGDTVVFRLQVKNPGTEDVSLDINNTIFSFADGADTVTAVVDSPAVLSAQTNAVTMRFVQAVIPVSFSDGNYTPQVRFAGTGDDGNLNGILSTDAGELAIEPLHIDYVRILDPPGKTVFRGGALSAVAMQVSNGGIQDINLDQAKLTFNPDEGFIVQANAGNPTTVPASGQVLLRYSVQVPQSAAADTVTIDGYVKGTTTVSGETIIDESADQTDRFVITSGVQLTYQDFSPQTVSENQQTAFSMTIRNDGDYDYLLNGDSTRLVFGTQSFLLNGNQTLAPNSTTTISFTSAPIQLAYGASYAGTLYAYGTENGQGVYDTLYTADGGDSLQVQSAADLNMTAIVLTDTMALQGQQGDTLKVAVRNSAEAAAVIASSDSVHIAYRSEYSLTSLQNFPYTLSGQSSDTLYYTVKVAADAPTGPDTFRVGISFYDQNSETTYSESNNALYADWRIIASGALRLLSVQSRNDSVSTGQNNVPVLVRLQNSGHYTVRVDSIRLNLPPENYEAGSLLRLPNRILQEAQSDTFWFYVDVKNNASSGTDALNAKAYGVNTFDGSMLSDLDADTTDSWLVQQAVAITVLDNQPVQISSGQNFRPAALVRNNGQAALLVDTTNSRMEISGHPDLSRRLTSPTVIPGNSSTKLYFESGTGSGASGSYGVEIHLEGTENNAAYNHTLPAPGDLTIQQPAVLQIDSVIAAAGNISQNTDTVVTVVVSNTGQASLALDSLILSPYANVVQSVSPALPYGIKGNTGQTFTLALTVPKDATTGSITLDARAVGRDSNWVNTGFDSTLTDDGANVTDQWTVYEPAAIRVTALSSADSVLSLGQADEAVHITIANSGGAPARITGLRLQKRIGWYSHSYPALNFVVNGGEDTTVTDWVDVKQNSATGLDTLNVLLNSTDLYSQKHSDYRSSDSLVWRITSSQVAVRIVSVTASQSSVSLGQNGAQVDVRIKNTSDSPVTLDSLQLRFSHNDTSRYRFGTISPAPGSMDSEADQTFAIPLDILKNAATGPDTMHARVYVHENVSGKTYWVEDATIYGVWTVQQRPQLTIDQVRLNPNRASTAQQNLRASVVLSNNAGAYRAAAQVDSIRLVLSLNGTDQSYSFTITKETAPSLPFTLQAGDSSRLDFTVDIKSSAASGTYSATARVVSRDVNDGQKQTTTQTADPGGLLVQQQAVLHIVAVQTSPDTLHQGQKNGLVRMVVHNSGEAGVQINSARLSFNPGEPEIDFNPLLSNISTPFTLNGGQSDTLIFSITAGTESYAGQDIISASVTGADINSAAALQSSLANADTLIIQTAADVSWLDTDPNESSGNENRQFTVAIRNNGQATVQLNRHRTMLEIWDNNFSIKEFSIPLADTGTAEIKADGQQTNLIFRETYLSGIDQGDYRFYLVLRGSSNHDTTFAQSLNAGILAYGDSIISIKRITVNKSNVVWGEKGIHVSMFIKNSVEPKTIDPVGTRLIFKDGAGNLLTVDNYQRTDTLTILQKQNNNELRFTFDIPEEFNVKTMYIYGQVSLNSGGSIVESSSRAEQYISSGGRAGYIAGTFTPDTVVAEQTVDFNAAFSDSGTADLTLVADSSYIEILGSSLDPLHLSGRYTLKGKDADSGVLDSTYVSFNSAAIPKNLSPGSYDVNWHLTARLPDGQSVLSSGTIAKGLTVINGAQLIVSQIIMDSVLVRQGQENIPLRMQVRNQGRSAAGFSGVRFDFWNVDQNRSVAGEWLVNTTPEFPDTLLAGASTWYTFGFNLNKQAHIGRDVPLPQLKYADLRTPLISRSTGSVMQNDTVTVVSPAALRIDSLLARKDVLAPNAPQVNINRAFNITVVLANTGSDVVSRAYLSVLKDNRQFDHLRLTDIAAGDTVHALRSYTLDKSGSFQFKVHVDSAFDKTGSAVTVLQPQDNVETIQAVTPANLQVAAVISAPAGAVDSLLSNGQNFTVSAQVTNTGQAAFGTGKLKMLLPEGFAFSGDTSSVRSFTFKNPAADWKLTVNKSKTTTIPDSLVVLFYQTPFDLNSGQPAVLSSASDTLNLRVQESGAITVSPLQTVAPAGALDGVVSTGQEIVLRSRFLFNPAMADSGRRLRLVLPEGYSIKDSAIVNLKEYAAHDSLDWHVFAPDAPPETSGSFYVLAEGTDGNSGLVKKVQSQKIQFNVVPRSSLLLSIKVTEPAGALDDTVSAGQVFRLQAKIHNRPQAAATTGRGSIHLRLGTQFALCDEQGQLLPADSVRAFSSDDSVRWWIKVRESSGAEALSAVRIGGAPALKNTRALRLAAELRQAIRENQIEAVIVQAPLDQNSNRQAFVQNPSQIKTMTIAEKAQILTVSATAPDTLSTGQTFVFRVQAGVNATVASASATLNIPQTLGASPSTPLPLDSGNRAQWNLSVPENYTGNGSETITVTISGIDQNSGRQVQLDAQKILTIREKSRLTLSDLQILPYLVKNTGLASRGQQITLRIKTAYAPHQTGLNYSGIKNTGTILLDSSITKLGFTLLGSSKYEQTFSDTGQVLSWVIKAPQQDLTAAFILKYNHLPLDKYSAKPVVLDGDSSTISIPVRVRRKTITVTLNQNIISDTTFTKPTNSVPLIAFTVSNKDYDDDLKISGLKLEFFSTEHLPLSPRSLTSLLKSISVVNLNDLQRLLAKNQNLQSTQGYIEYQLSDTTENPLNLKFDQQAIVAPHQEGRLVVLARFQDNVLNRSFRAVLRNVNVYDFDPEHPLEIIDSNGTKIDESTLLNSKDFVVVSENPQEAFGNFPNPFGRRYDHTNITFRLTEQSDVDIRIFTLLGQLVWSRKLQGVAGGYYESLVKWDGRNSRGHMVLNGIYLCAIDIKPLNGKPKKRYITKIAFIK